MSSDNLSTYQAGILQAKAYRSLHALLGNLLQEYDLTMMQWAVLGVIYDAGEQGIQGRDIATEIDTTDAFVTRNVHELIARGMVIQASDTTDLRAKILRVNPEYVRTVELIELGLQRDVSHAVGIVLSPREVGLYIKLIRKLSKVNAAPTPLQQNC